MAIDVDGAAWLFGRNDKGALGVPGVDAISENAPVRLTARELGASKGTRFVHAAGGRSHTLLVGSGGQVWSAGGNPLGQVRRGGVVNGKRALSISPVWPSTMPGDSDVQVGPGPEE